MYTKYLFRWWLRTTIMLMIVGFILSCLIATIGSLANSNLHFFQTLGWTLLVIGSLALILSIYRLINRYFFDTIYADKWNTTPLNVFQADETLDITVRKEEIRNWKPSDFERALFEAKQKGYYA